MASRLTVPLLFLSKFSYEPTTATRLFYHGREPRSTLIDVHFDFFHSRRKKSPLSARNCATMPLVIGHLFRAEDALKLTA